MLYVIKAFIHKINKGFVLNTIYSYYIVVLITYSVFMVRAVQLDSSCSLPLCSSYVNTFFPNFKKIIFCNFSHLLCANFLNCVAVF